MPGAEWLEEDSDNDPRRHYYWIRKALIPKADGSLEMNAGHYANDLNRGIGTLAAPELTRGHARETTYTGFVATAVPNLDIKSSTRTLTLPSGRHHKAKCCLDYLYGQLWNNKLATRYKRPLMGRRAQHAPSSGAPAPCPLCGGPDSGGHILGGCRHAQLRAMYIKRHNIAVQLLARAISRGTRGGGYMVMDATSKNDLPDYIDSNRLPPWLFPTTAPDQPNPHLQFRPDILFIPSIKLAETKHPDFYVTPANTHTVHIIEVGYGADTNHTGKQHEKAQQHQRLAEELRSAGWRVEYTPHTAISLGFAGTIRKDLLPLLTDLGVSHHHARKCCDALHDHAVSSLNNIVLARRRLERGQPLGDPGGS